VERNFCAVVVVVVGQTEAGAKDGGSCPIKKCLWAGQSRIGAAAVHSKKSSMDGRSTHDSWIEEDAAQEVDDDVAGTAARPLVGKPSSLVYD